MGSTCFRVGIALAACSLLHASGVHALALRRVDPARLTRWVIFGWSI